MARPKKEPDRLRTAWVQVRTSPAWLEWLRSLAIKAGDREVAALIERLAEAEAERVGHDPSPGR